MPPGSDREVTSAPALGVFTTRPLPPSDFRVEENKIIFSRSLTGGVRLAPNLYPLFFVFTLTLLNMDIFCFRAYKVKYKSVEEGSKAEEFHVSCDEQDSAAVSLNILVSADYFPPKFSIIFPGLSDARSSLQDKYYGARVGHQQTSCRVPAVA